MHAHEVDARQLKYFLAIVEHGTMTGAASAMHVAQPSLSKAIRVLEGSLGTPLFHRVGRGLVLSAAGAALVGPARQTMRDMATARASVMAVGELMAGWLDLTTVPTLAVDPLAELIGAFRACYPDVSIRLHEAEIGAVAHSVYEGESELGVAPLPFKVDNLTVHELSRQELVIVAPPGTPLPGASELLSVADLQAVPMIASPVGTSTRALLDSAFEAVGATPRIAVEVASREAIVPLVLHGAGATLLPTGMAEVACRRGAVRLQPDPPITRQIGIAHRAGPLSPAARAFLRIAAGEDEAARKSALPIH